MGLPGRRQTHNDFRTSKVSQGGFPMSCRKREWGWGLALLSKPLLPDTSSAKDLCLSRF